MICDTDLTFSHTFAVAVSLALEKMSFLID